MARVLVGVVAILALGLGQVQAGGCGAVVSSVRGVSGFHVAATNQFLVAVPYALPVATPVSAYSPVGYGPAVAGYHAPPMAGYDPFGQPAAAASACSCGHCQAGAAATPGPSATAAPEPPGLGLLRQRCGGCHQPGGAGESAFALLTDGGKWADGWRSKAAAITSAVVNQTMPPADKPKLTADERLAILGAIYHGGSKQ